MSLIKWVLTQIESVHYLDEGHQRKNQLRVVVPDRGFVGLASNSENKCLVITLGSVKMSFETLPIHMQNHVKEKIPR